MKVCVQLVLRIQMPKKVTQNHFTLNPCFAGFQSGTPMIRGGSRGGVQGVRTLPLASDNLLLSEISSVLQKRKT